MTEQISSVVTKQFYISTGRKSGFYTLRAMNFMPGAGIEPPDNHVMTLTASEDTSIDKAQRYVDAFRSRVPETDHFKIEFDACIDNEVIPRRGNLSVRDSQHIEIVENGIMPFGKNKGKVIAELSEASILWYSDQSKNANGAVMSAICDRCAGIAAERGYFQARQVRRAEEQATYASSAHVGEIKQRLDFSGKILFIKECGGYFVGNEITPVYWLHKIICDGNVIIYSGSKVLGERGDNICFRATVKHHGEYQGIMQTIVNRPAVLVN